MTSRARAPSQIDSRVAYLRGLATGATYLIANPEAIYRTSQTNVITTQSSQIAAGNLFRDMGKTVTRVNAAGLAIERYRLVQRVNNASAEGVQNATVYIKVWSADGAGVVVARSG
jgi:hypothetical protein